MKGNRERILAAGCDEYLSKPVQPKALIDLVNQLLARSKGAERQSETGPPTPRRRTKKPMTRILLVDDGAGGRPAALTAVARAGTDRARGQYRWRADAAGAPC